MNQEIDRLLNGLLGNPPDTAAKTPTASTGASERKPATSERASSASEEARRRVEEIMRSVELETSQKRAAQPPKQEWPIPRHEPVVVPPPVSHFSEEPSQDTAVRMHDRLDETSLPMIDNEKKPNQIIPPKPKPEQQKKKRKKKKPAAAQSVQPVPPAPDSRPKRRIPHIEIPDELPPDIPRDTTIADERRRKKQEEQRLAENTSADLSPEESVKAEIAREPEQTETPVSSEAPIEAETMSGIPEKLSVHEKANLIRERMRRLREEEDAERAMDAEIPPTAEEEQCAEPEAEPQPAAEPETENLSLHEKADLIRESIRLMHEELSSLPSPMETDPSQEAASEEPEASAEPDDPVEEETVLSKESKAAPAEPETSSEEADCTTNEAVEEAPVLRHLTTPEEEKTGFWHRFLRKKKWNPTEIPLETAEETAEIPDETPQELEETETLAEPPQEEAEPEFPGEASAERDAGAESLEEGTAAEKDAGTESPEEEISVKHAETEDSEEEISAKHAETASPEEETSATEDIPPVQEEKAGASIDITLPGESGRQKKHAFIAAIHEALDESAQELAEIKAEPIPEPSEIDVALGRPQFWRRYAYFIVGICCTLLAVVGLATCIVKGREIVLRFASSASLKSELEECLYPIAVVDLPAFESVSELNSESVLSAAMIDLLMYEDLSGYPCSFDVYSIPAKDVRAHAASLFGTEIDLTDTSLHAAGETFYYDSTADCYNVPASPVIFSYAPEICGIKRSGDLYTVTVRYCSDTAQWQQKSKNFSSNGTKMMEITMQKMDDTYQIIRVVNISDESELGV